MMKYYVIGAMALVLAACSSPEPIVKLVPASPPQIPSSLLTCPDSPEVPDDAATQADVGRYVLDLYSAGADCRSNLTAVGKLIKDSEPDDRR